MIPDQTVKTQVKAWVNIAFQGADYLNSGGEVTIAEAEQLGNEIVTIIPEEHLSTLGVNASAQNISLNDS